MSSQEQLEQEEVVTRFIGTEFVVAREAKGVSIESVASDLNFSAKHIVAIEEGRLEDLPDRVFALGYLRAYARYLGLSEQEAVAAYEEVVGGGSSGSKVKPVGTVNTHFDASESKSSAAKWVLPAVLVVIAAVGAFWWQGQSVNAPVIEAPVVETPVADDTNAQVVVNEPVVTDEAASGVETVNPDGTNMSEAVVEAPAVESNGVEAQAVVESAVVQAQEDTSGAAQAESPIAVDEAVVTAGSSASKTEPTAVEPLPAVVAVSEPVVGQAAAVSAEFAGQGALKIEFNADCWVEVRDSAGKLLVASVRNATRGVDVVGVPPINVTIGAVSAVNQLSYNGEPVALAARGRGNVLRLTLPVAE